MKKNELSLAEKKSIRAIFLFILVQFFIVVSFVLLLRGSRQIDINDTKQIDIIVEDVNIVRVPREYQLFIVADSTTYLFYGRATLKELSVYELYNTISKGDRLSLIYYESDRLLFKKVNVVVDARTETETYRTFEEYNRGKQGVPVFVVILYSIIESVFGGVVLVYIWINHKIIKSVYRKVKKHS